PLPRRRGSSSELYGQSRCSGRGSHSGADTAGRRLSPALDGRRPNPRGIAHLRSRYYLTAKPLSSCRHCSRTEAATTTGLLAAAFPTIVSGTSRLAGLVGPQVKDDAVSVAQDAVIAALKVLAELAVVLEPPERSVGEQQEFAALLPKCPQLSNCVRVIGGVVEPHLQESDLP